MTGRGRPADDAVARLPVDAGRAELLAEVLASPARGGAGPHRRRARAGATWTVPLAVAVVALVLGCVPLWVGAWVSERPSAPAYAVAPPAADDRMVLEAAGWRVTYVDTDAYGIGYARGDQTLTVSAKPAELYESYLRSRRSISEPASDGRPVEVAGVPGRMWAYTADDHAVVREVQGGRWLEIRGAGMDRAAYLALLDRLRLVDRATLEASLPERFVTAEERPAAVAAMTDGVARVIGPDLGLTPTDLPASAFGSDDADPTALGSHVAGVVACSWLRSYVEGRASGDARQVDDAVTALGTWARWPVLEDVGRSSDYPQVVGVLAADAADGRDVDGFESDLGCG